MCRSELVHKSVSELLVCVFDGFSRGILSLWSNKDLTSEIVARSEFAKDLKLSLCGLTRESLEK